MTDPDSGIDDLEPGIADQVEHIIRAFHREGIAIDVVPSGRGVGYMYARGHLLVRDEYLERVLQILHLPPHEPTREPEEPAREPDGPARESDGPAREPEGTGREPDEAAQDPDEAAPEPGGSGREPGEPGHVQRVIAGVVLLTLDPGRHTVPSALRHIDQQLGEGIASPDHVLTVAPEVGPCPATEPQEVYEGIEPYPSACPGSGGAGVLIYIADTGLLPDAESHSWLAGGVRAGDLDPPPSPDQDGVHTIHPYTGHGTFVAGVARCLAPAADVIVANAFAIAGSALESHFVRHLEAALRLGVDIFHLSVTAPCRKDLPLIAFEKWLKRTRQYKGVVCVVAAGNSGSRRPMWPAAFSEVVSVGALAGDWRSRAEFSNHGGWVDVYAPGRNLVNAYATGTYTCHVRPYKGEPRKFYGMARWSGTSFSTPIVTGLIAARMSRSCENGRQAAAALLAEARAQAIPGVGAILLPHCGNDRMAGRG